MIECTKFIQWRQLKGAATILEYHIPSSPDIYMYTKYHQNISKGIRVFECKSVQL